ncbi:prolyl-tRNA synthetase associated domain-containing protein [Roseospira marina]|uniref:Prolyl-tRNA synthetase associated domain-containing protein n=1 Tax=Roseospira marina TaxID=140057 RepID=A0A5M6IGY0_9PROT|nr:prolyl-tRNA synthetase associated domain-containing protein [Roseospira marina]KAA5607543.1 prolyl-tRNA synthetase associated domain-containing protein [Roseospira marina]MBB4312271.1 Ala-tRNA(Pro) deacylase [Roseospira marina]MBB5085713.1 Ala-tRNA(Pro) deacylase [Roseospira marina]
MTLPAHTDSLFACLAGLGIETSTVEHPAVFTVEEAKATHDTIPGVHCKNLFLKDAKGALFLVVCPHDRDIAVNHLHKHLGCKRLSFGKPDLLMEVLRVEPGSVTPFALIHDAERRVTVILDSAMMAAPVANYHPLVNTATTSIRTADLRLFLDSLGHEVRDMDLTAAGAAPPTP